MNDMIGGQLSSFLEEDCFYAKESLVQRMKRISFLRVLFFVAVLLCLPAMCAAPRNCSAEIKVYFSPNGGIREQVIRAMDLATSSLDIAIFNCSSRQLAGSIVKAKERGVRIGVVTDKRKASGKKSKIGYLVQKGVAVRLVKGRGNGNMHNKFAIFDKKLVLIGSYNWTEKAEQVNYDNAVFIDAPNVVSTYQREFDRLWKKQ